MLSSALVTFELPSVLSAGLGILCLLDSHRWSCHPGLGKPNSNTSSSKKFSLASKGNLHPLSSKLRQRKVLLFLLTLSSQVFCKWFMLVSSSNVGARKYIYTSDMALRPSSLHLLNVYNLPGAVPSTGINKNKIWICYQRDHSLMLWSTPLKCKNVLVLWRTLLCFWNSFLGNIGNPLIPPFESHCSSFKLVILLKSQYSCNNTLPFSWRSTSMWTAASDFFQEIAVGFHWGGDRKSMRTLES